MATARTEFRTPVFILELTEEEVDDLRVALDARLNEKHGSSAELRNLLNISTALKGAINGSTG